MEGTGRRIRDEESGDACAGRTSKESLFSDLSCASQVGAKKAEIALEIFLRPPFIGRPYNLAHFEWENYNNKGRAGDLQSHTRVCSFSTRFKAGDKT